MYQWRPETLKIERDIAFFSFGGCVTHDLGEVRKNYTGVAAEVTRELETSTVRVSLT